jgi:hypothetical protein
MARCSGIRADGGRCGAQAIRSSEYCVSHHPDYEDTRRRRNSKGGRRGGRGRPSAELATLKERLTTLAAEVLAGEVDRADAAVAGQLLNTVIRAVSVELKAREQLELVERLEVLEETLARNKENRWYGA